VFPGRAAQRDRPHRR